MLNRKKKGQGIVEYAGAIIVAAVIVAALIALAPDGIGAAFDTIIDAVGAYMVTLVP